MKNRKITLLLATLLAAALLLSACGSAKPSIEGKWSAEALAKEMQLEELVGDKGLVYEFTKDGNVNMLVGNESLVDFMRAKLKEMGMTDEQIGESMEGAPEMRYEIKGDQITMKMTMGDYTSEITGPFTVTKDTLTLPGDETDKAKTITMTRAK